MKTLFVTVAEFLENGGSLDDKMTIYNDNKFPLGKWIATVNDTTQVKRDNHPKCIRKNTILFVEINCTPHYV